MHFAVEEKLEESLSYKVSVWYFKFKYLYDMN